MEWLCHHPQYWVDSWTTPVTVSYTRTYSGVGQINISCYRMMKRGIMYPQTHNGRHEKHTLHVSINCTLYATRTNSRKSYILTVDGKCFMFTCS